MKRISAVLLFLLMIFISQDAFAQGINSTNTAYNKPLMTYTFLFFIFAFSIYWFLRKKQIKNTDYNYDFSIYIILAIGLLVRIIAALNVEGFSTDIGCFIAWASTAAKDLTNFYNSSTFCDYPPLYIYVLYIIGKLGSILGTGVNSLLVKLPAIMADLVTAYFLYKLSKKNFKSGIALIIAGLYVFNPVVLLDSALWGQVDSFFTMLLVIALFQLTAQRINLSSAVFTIAFLMKPQAIFILPVLLFELLKRRSLKDFATALLTALGTAAIIILPFSREPVWIFNLFFKTAEGYKYASLNAFNLFGMFGANLKEDSFPFIIFSYKIWGLVFDVLLLAFAGMLYLKGKHKSTPLLVALLLNAGFFTVSVRMHERYMFPVIALALFAFIYIKDRRILIAFSALTITNFININAVLYRMIGSNYPHVSPNSPVIILTSFANVLIFAYIVKISIDILLKDKIIPFEIANNNKTKFTKASKVNRRKKMTSASIEYEIPVAPIGLKLDRKDLIIMAIMTLFYLAITLPNLGNLKAPETSWKPVRAGESIILDLGRTVNVSRLYYYGGLGDGVYNISYADGSGAYKPISDLQKKDIFVWKYVDLGSVSTDRLKLIVNVPGGTLNEIGIVENGSKIPLRDIRILGEGLDAGDVGKIENLFDEQETIDYKHSYLSGMIFDEIYHARTAYEYLNHLEPFEWTHPPLGKILISLGITVFGMNPFGWRIVGTLFGVAMVPIMYLFGRKLFGNRFYGFCSAFLMMFDFMHFSLTRIATIDVYGTFFVILMYYYMYDYYVNRSYVLGFRKSLKPLFICGIFFGLGAASKWIGLYAGGGLALLFFMAKYHEYKEYYRINTNKKAKKPSWLKDFIPIYLKRTFVCCIFFFIIIPVVIYGLSYIPYMSVPGPGHGFDLIFRNQRDMLNYHSVGVLGNTHPFSSSWWEWPIIRRPLETYLGSDLSQGMSSSMTIMGNPAVWWIGIFAVAAAVYMAIKRKETKMTVVFTAMAFQFLPWIPIQRLTFIYHYFSTVPFMILAIVYVIKNLTEKYKNMRYVTYAYLAIVLVLFIMFYPVLSGMEVPRTYVEGFLLWFKNHWFF